MFGWLMLQIVETSKWVYLILELAEGGDMYEFLKVIDARNC